MESLNNNSLGSLSPQKINLHQSLVINTNPYQNISRKGLNMSRNELGLNASSLDIHNLSLP